MRPAETIESGCARYLADPAVRRSLGSLARKAPVQLAKWRTEPRVVQLAKSVSPLAAADIELVSKRFPHDLLSESEAHARDLLIRAAAGPILLCQALVYADARVSWARHANWIPAAAHSGAWRDFFVAISYSAVSHGLESSGARAPEDVRTWCEGTECSDLVFRLSSEKAISSGFAQGSPSGQSPRGNRGHQTIERISAPSLEVLALAAANDRVIQARLERAFPGDSNAQDRARERMLIRATGSRRSSKVHSVDTGLIFLSLKRAILDIKARSIALGRPLSESGQYIRASVPGAAGPQDTDWSSRNTLSRALGGALTILRSELLELASDDEPLGDSQSIAVALRPREDACEICSALIAHLDSGAATWDDMLSDYTAALLSGAALGSRAEIQMAAAGTDATIRRRAAVAMRTLMIAIRQAQDGDQDE